MDPFRAHLVALLSIYELGPFSGTPNIPRYEGPTDWQTESILKSLDAIAQRMYSAKETVVDLQKKLVNMIYQLDMLGRIILTKLLFSRNVKLSSRSYTSKVLVNSLLSGKKFHRFKL